MKHLNIRVVGSVQGVWFRDSCRKEADKLEIKGFARNDPDGTVYIEAEGNQKSLNKLVEWCHRGSGQSQVRGVMRWYGEMQNFEDFNIG